LGTHAEVADGRSSDGKSLLHQAVAMPSLMASELQNVVRHTAAGWEKGTDTTNKTDFRNPTLLKIEQRVIDFVKSIVIEAPELAQSADAAGLTPLHIAAREGMLQSCEVLLLHGANPNAADESGQTPLHMAAIFGSPEIAELLIKHGADRKAADKYGFTFDDYLASPGIGIWPEDAKSRFGVTPRAAIIDPLLPGYEGSGGECAADGGWDTGAPDQDPEQFKCDIDQRTDLDPEEWYKEYYLRGRPVLIRGALPLEERCAMSKTNMHNSEMLKSLKCGATAYPSITRQKFCPEQCTLDSLETSEDCVDRPVGSDKSHPPRHYKPTAVVGHSGAVDAKGKNKQWFKLLPERYRVLDTARFAELGAQGMRTCTGWLCFFL
jgi:hypothetical protein